MKVLWQAEMKVSGIEPPSDPGGPAVLKLAFKGAIDGESMANLAYMMKAPWVMLSIEQVQANFNIDRETGEIL